MVSKTQLGLALFVVVVASAQAAGPGKVLQPQCNVNPAQIGVDLFGWLTPDRLKFLQGGRFQWVTSDGRVLVPGTPDWTVAFGDLSYPGFLALLHGNWAWDSAFKWVNPNIIDVVHGGDFVNLFGWLDAHKLELLQGGHWDPIKIQWYTPGGQIIVPGTPDWNIYFGPHVLPDHLNILFPNGGNWDDFFGWLTPGFLQEHIRPEKNPWLWVPEQPHGFGVYTPDIRTLFNQGKFNWLTPDRLLLLRGGYWDMLLNGWINPKGELIRPGTPGWTVYFGDLAPGDLLTLLNGTLRWNEAFGWLTPGVIQVLHGGGQPTDWTTLLGWLTPGRLPLLQGGHFDIVTGHWINGQGQEIVPGTPDWVLYFGPVLTPDDLRILFGGITGGRWEDFFGWITPEWITINIIPDHPHWNPPPPPTAPPTPPPTTPAPTPPPVVIPTPPPHGPNIHVIEIPPNWDWTQFNIPREFIPWFTTGQLNWLTPERWTLLQGGHWEPSRLVWITGTGQEVRPGTPDWVRFFGNFTPDKLSILFPRGGDWTTIFGFLTPQFLQQWQIISRPISILGFGVWLPNNLINFFQNHGMKWLNPDRYALLQGGRWDAPNKVWYNAQGQPIQPGTLDWIRYFGTMNPDFLNQWFPNGGKWEDVFGFMQPEFFDQWKEWMPFGGAVPPAGAGDAVMIPGELINFFQGGQMNWLNPDRWALLQGGGWDIVHGGFLNSKGELVQPGTPQWTQYFGDLNPELMKQWFPYGGAWSDVFGFITPDFFNKWQGWKPQGGVFQIPGQWVELFQGPQFSWLNPERVALLQGGHWDGTKWITGNGMTILPNSPQWVTYFGNFRPEDMVLLFPSGSGYWDQQFSWLNQPGFWQWWQVSRPKPVVNPLQSLMMTGEFRIPISKISGHIIEMFKSGRLNWLNPNRIRSLQGGRWDAGSSTWITGTGQIIRPDTAEWQQLFAPFTGEHMRQLFPQGGVWNDTFGWLITGVAKVPAEASGGIWPWDVMFKNMKIQSGNMGVHQGTMGIQHGTIGMQHGTIGSIPGRIGMGTIGSIPARG